MGQLIGSALAIWVFVKIIKSIVRFFSDSNGNNGGQYRQNECIIYDENEICISELNSTMYLTKYKGSRNSLIVPRGVNVIDGNDEPIGPGGFRSIWIPRSVRYISSAALMFCESVCYEGSAAEWNQIGIDEDNFLEGWKPSWYKEDPGMNDYRVKVHYMYNIPSSIWESEEQKIMERKRNR